MIQPATRKRRPNILLVAADSLRADHLSGYGYDRLTTPHLDEFAQECTLFEQTSSAHIPAAPAYASMLTGRDCFGTGVVATRHAGGLTPKVVTLPEVLRQEGYLTTCIGLSGNAAVRGFDRCLDYAPIWGAWADRPLRKGESLNDVAVPEIARLARSGTPWLLLLRPMDPRAPYLPPAPWNRMFYYGQETDPANLSMRPALEFEPFAEYLQSWLPPGITDSAFVVGQYDGAVAYLDACLEVLFEELDTLRVLDDTIVVVTADHGETLGEHPGSFDHHGLYDTNLSVPLLIRYPKRLPMGKQVWGHNQHKDLMPTLLELAGIRARPKMDGRSLLKLVDGWETTLDSEFYITECTWMRKHGWRTPEWKLIEALEPDFHGQPPVELYNLTADPDENHNLAERCPEVVAYLYDRMQAFVARRERRVGTPNPMLTQGDWAGCGAPFKSSDEARRRLRVSAPWMPRPPAGRPAG